MTQIIEQLIKKKCKPCEGGVEPMTNSQIESFIKELSGWVLSDNRIHKSFQFSDHHSAIAFLNAVAWISHTEDHHPDIKIGYDTCEISYWTHAISGLSENDFICAAKVDKLLAN